MKLTERRQSVVVGAKTKKEVERDEPDADPWRNEGRDANSRGQVQSLPSLPLGSRTKLTKEARHIHESWRRVVVHRLRVARPGVSASGGGSPRPRIVGLGREVEEPDEMVGQDEDARGEERGRGE